MSKYDFYCPKYEWNCPQYEWISPEYKWIGPIILKYKKNTEIEYKVRNQNSNTILLFNVLNKVKRKFNHLLKPALLFPYQL